MISSVDILQGKILIVDDLEVNILIFDRMLRGAGYDLVTSTMNPREVCALHLKHQYDLIVLDLQMPGMDGFQVMEELKQIEPDGYLPVLVVTAQPGHKLRALQAGAKDFISKPFDLPEVLVRVRNLLEVRLLHKKLLHYNGLMEQKVHEQTTLLNISHILASTLELQPALILGQLQEIIEYTHGVLFKLEDSALVTLAMYGMESPDPTSPLHVVLNTSENIETLLTTDQFPILIADVSSDDPQARFLRSILTGEAAVLLEGIQSWMWVPVAAKGRMIGVVGLAHNTPDYFTNHHADLTLSVANKAAITMINTELNKQAQALAVMEERQNLARDLHDAVNQSLFSAGLIAEILPRLWDKDQVQARQALGELHRLTRGAQAEMRVLLAELRPSTLNDSNLGDLLRLQRNAFSGRTNVPVKLITSQDFNLPAAVQVAFYRLCQEALNNIAKHAKASQVEIELKQDAGVIELRISDNGVGFDTDQIFSGHYGLDMMRERAEAVGALFSVTSQPGRTEIKIRWVQTPLKEPV